MKAEDLIALLLGCAIGTAIYIVIELRRSPSTWERLLRELREDDR